jgi:hypothetical protein
MAAGTHFQQVCATSLSRLQSGQRDHTPRTPHHVVPKKSAKALALPLLPVIDPSLALSLFRG